MSNTQLAVTGLDHYTVALTPEAQQRRQDLLEVGGLITTVSDTDEQSDAVQATRLLKAWNSEVEKTRVELKAPLLDAGRLLDQTAKEATLLIEKEVKRIEGLLSDFQRLQEQRRIAAQRERERIEREERLAREKAEEEERQRIAEIERQRLEAERLAISARSKAKREEAAAAAEKLAREQEQAELAADFKVVAAPIPYTPLPEVVKAKGSQTKRVIKFEIIDIKALAAAYPNCVELVPKVQPINYLLATPGLDLNSIPGLKAWEDTAVIVRGS